jgi:RecA/RadA recombinase
MTYQFKKAVREEVGLLIGLIGPSGSGKTFSAMRLAAGIVGSGNRFAVIDTESRRALHYADMFAFDHLELSAPFRPDTYANAIKAADDKGYPAIVVDSCSHE